MEYKLIGADKTEELVGLVNEALKDGWQLSGTIVIDPSIQVPVGAMQCGYKYYQAVVKPAEGSTDGAA